MFVQPVECREAGIILSYPYFELKAQVAFFWVPLCMDGSRMGGDQQEMVVPLVSLRNPNRHDKKKHIAKGPL